MTIIHPLLYRVLGLLAVAATVGNVVIGFKTGDIAFFHTTLNRSTNPAMFWFAVVFSGIAAVACLASVIVIWINPALAQ